jgi:peptidoglycan/LPS O-acetylase OafA/YrhL
VLFHVYDMMSWASAWLESVIGADWTNQLTFSKRFVADYVLGVLVFVNFAGVRNVVAQGSVALQAIERPIRFLANYTFTLYLLHQPLFLFWSAVVRGDPNAPWYWTIVTVLTMLSVVAVGYFTENRRHGFRLALVAVFRRWESGWLASFLKAPSPQLAAAQAGALRKDERH